MNAPQADLPPASTGRKPTSAPLSLRAPLHPRPVAAPGQRLALLFFGSYALIFIVIVISVWALVARDRQRELARQQTELVSLARALEEHVARTVGHMDSSLQFLTRLLDNEPRISQASVDTLSTYARNWLKSAPHAAALSITDAHGQPLLLVQQPWLRAAANYPPVAVPAWRSMPDAGMRIGLPIRLNTQDGKEWFIPVEQGITGIGGKLIGIASGLISTRYFEQFYHDIQFAPRDTISLLSSDGRLLLRYPTVDALMGSDQSSAPIFGSSTQSSDQSRSLVFSGAMQIDGVPHITAYRRLSHYPLLVGISRPQDGALANYFEMRNRVVVGGCLLISLLALTGWIIFHDTRQRELDRAELSEINTSLEERVSRRTAELEQSNRDLVGFSYSVSHDLRTPLRAINGFAHALLEDSGDKLDAQGKDYLARIGRASVRMGELIDELLNLANVSRRPLNVRPVQLSNLVSDLFEELRIAEPDRVVKLHLQPELQAEGDEALLRNALSNLLHNAWKFTRGESVGEITITAHPTPDCMNYSIADNGVGFDMAHAKRLFQPFQQLHGDQGFGGTGIGLASVRRIIERHGGRIWAESSPGEGARFIFTLPHRVSVVRRRRREVPLGPETRM
ncbi:ATP-binding protein [Uliginosibacterium sp. H3]|uniref:histidine kinase n=1 Tax=Uliginosibacterium silvisoli TaxID=3114758 RepID=A0ABU6K507_9RHOO|nr:ATP-binding protein [Uliginosibacterium sp. H3]